MALVKRRKKLRQESEVGCGFYGSLAMCANCDRLFPFPHLERGTSPIPTLCVFCKEQVDLWPLKAIAIEQDPRFDRNFRKALDWLN